MFAVLRSVATANGLRLTLEGNVIRIDAIEAGMPQTGTQRSNEQQQLFVYRLKHARAPRMANTLQALYGSPAGATTTPVGLTDRMLSTQLRSTLIAPLSLDTLNKVNPNIAQPIVVGGLIGAVQFVPDETTNSLLIRALPTDYPSIRLAIEALDLRPLQVFIEVLIAEVRKSYAIDVGVTASVVNAGNGNLTSVSLTSPMQDAFLARFIRDGDVKVDVALSALAARGTVRVLSRPLVLAENNLEARILVGSQRPFVQVFRSLPTNEAVRDQIVQYRDVGNVLSLLPTINSDGYVDLQVRQEVSTATNEEQFGAPIFATREASTHLYVRDGQTVVIGGLADRTVERNRSGIPFLMDIPYIGWLFGSTHNNEIRSELYLFLTPHIVASDEDAERLKNEVEHRLDSRGGKVETNPPVVPPVKPPANPNP
jgi:general secretion pathway protein D